MEETFGEHDAVSMFSCSSHPLDPAGGTLKRNVFPADEAEGEHRLAWLSEFLKKNEEDKNLLKHLLTSDAQNNRPRLFYWTGSNWQPVDHWFWFRPDVLKFSTRLRNILLITLRRVELKGLLHFNRWKPVEIIWLSNRYVVAPGEQIKSKSGTTRVPHREYTEEPHSVLKKTWQEERQIMVEALEGAVFPSRLAVSEEL